MYSIMINAGPLSSDDNEIYFTQIPPVFIGKTVTHAPDDKGVQRTDHETWVEIQPNNGASHVRGKKMQIPRERVVFITEDAS